MKAVYLAIVLGAMLLVSATHNTSYASPDQGVKIMAKEKQGKILLMVKNEQSRIINSVKIKLLDGTITSVKAGYGWAFQKSSDSKSITLTTGVSALKSQESAIFFIGASNINSIISWSVHDRSGSTIDADNARITVKQTLDRVLPAGKELTYVQNARTMTLKTDKIFYSKGEKMIISGVLDPNTPVVITIYSPNGQKVKISQSTDPTGSFRALHMLQNAESGTYRIKVNQADGYAETTFKIL
jgi:hypothetical protein